jgi:hypothetical protein
MKQRSNSLGDKSNYNELTFDDHEHGIWRGMVKMSLFKGEVPLVGTYLDLNAKRGTIFLILLYYDYISILMNKYDIIMIIIYNIIR